MEVHVEEGSGKFKPMTVPIIDQKKRNIFDHYKFHKDPIGRGGCSLVYLATNFQGDPFAVKYIHATHSEFLQKSESLVREVSILKKLSNHPNILHIVDFFEEHRIKDQANHLEASSFHMILELLKGGELFDQITQKTVFSEHEARNYAKVILKAMKFCHDQNIVHR
jgi:calcium-dependent protein kinase